jgi:hypothetical protein
MALLGVVLVANPATSELLVGLDGAFDGIYTLFACA